MVNGFYDELGFSESVCSGFKWSGNSLEVFFQNGIDLGSNHPLSNSFKFGDPCRLLFDGVIKSKLRVSHLISSPNNFEHHYFENLDLHTSNEEDEYIPFYLEGVMMATSPTGWFVWDLVAQTFTFDDLS